MQKRGTMEREERMAAWGDGKSTDCRRRNKAQQGCREEGEKEETGKGASDEYQLPHGTWS